MKTGPKESNNFIKTYSQAGVIEIKRLLLNKIKSPNAELIGAFIDSARNELGSKFKEEFPSAFIGVIGELLHEAVRSQQGANVKMIIVKFRTTISDQYMKRASNSANFAKNNEIREIIDNARTEIFNNQIIEKRENVINRFQKWHKASEQEIREAQHRREPFYKFIMNKKVDDIAKLLVDGHQPDQKNEAVNNTKRDMQLLIIHDALIAVQLKILEIEQRVREIEGDKSKGEPKNRFEKICNGFANLIDKAQSKAKAYFSKEVDIAINNLDTMAYEFSQKHQVQVQKLNDAKEATNLSKEKPGEKSFVDMLSDSRAQHSTFMKGRY